jgi:hypothetical protein
MKTLQPRGARRAAAKELWRKTRRRARNQQGISANTLWQMVNDQPAQQRFAQQQKRKAVTSHAAHA